MIGKAYKVGAGFKGLAAYLQYGKRDGSERDRVDWIEARNLPTVHPQAAARIMMATARDSDSVQPPVYHFSVSFPPDDPVNRETMRRVADRTLRDLGLQDHQVLIIAHRFSTIKSADVIVVMDEGWTMSASRAAARSGHFDLSSMLRRARRNSSFGYRDMRSEWNMYMIS